MENRENFKSRIGFIMTSAGCAIGLGNVWRFPFITGQYGGAAFVLFYLLFLVLLGAPIMVMEFAVGRASGKSAVRSFHELEPKGSKWHVFGYFAAAGNYLLMMFYTTVAGWMFAYIFKSARGTFSGLNAEQIGGVFGTMLANPVEQLCWMTAVIIIGFLICMGGLKNGVEKASTIIMTSLLFLMLILVVRAVTLPGAGKGLAFYLKPDFSKMAQNGWGEVIFAAMGQAFFTLSLGIGALAIFGSYIGKEKALTGEALHIITLDTFVALMAGFIIFPACFAFGVNPGQGPGLIFVTLPNIFNSMLLGRLWGTLFFVFMSFAALSTVIAVFENIIAFAMDRNGWSRKKAVIVNIVLVLVLSIPCTLGFNVWSNIVIPKIGNIQDIEDFIVSNNLLPLGSLVYLVFCTSRYGWGFDNFIQEANTGSGIKFPHALKFYVSCILPMIAIVIWAVGYLQKFILK
ncbi:MAG: sodium-dependent transporter [Treponema sp.]|uniref:sodium-dependent transporter n=1 Tax=Treponema sp. TaxID=166 RepID=UPI002A90DCFB|nr:sodium-dependent transporter [Treponema sp.]MDY6397984.1 sodium-dependent transporter [Treponema sp.]